jgi:hypothetical protein
MLIIQFDRNELMNYCSYMSYSAELECLKTYRQQKKCIKYIYNLLGTGKDEPLVN